MTYVRRAYLCTPLVLILAACAPQTEYEREDRLNRAQDSFATRERQCRAAGGFMVMKRYGSLRGNPSASELDTAQCARY